MLSKLELTNFQGFKDHQQVRFAPLTLIFGPNASGKSSIGRALKVVAQTMGNIPSMPEIQWNGPNVALDSLHQVSYAKRKNDVSVAVTFAEISSGMPESMGYAPNKSASSFQVGWTAMGSFDEANLLEPTAWIAFNAEDNEVFKVNFLGHWDEYENHLMSLLEEIHAGETLLPDEFDKQSVIDYLTGLGYDAMGQPRYSVTIGEELDHKLNNLPSFLAETNAWVAKTVHQRT